MQRGGTETHRDLKTYFPVNINKQGKFSSVKIVFPFKELALQAGDGIAQLQHERVAVAVVDFATGHANVTSAQQGCSQQIIPNPQLLGTILCWSEK